MYEYGEFKSKNGRWSGVYRLKVYHWINLLICLSKCFLTSTLFWSLIVLQTAVIDHLPRQDNLIPSNKLSQHTFLAMPSLKITLNVQVPTSFYFRMSTFLMWVAPFHRTVQSASYWTKSETTQTLYQCRAGNSHDQVKLTSPLSSVVNTEPKSESNGFPFISPSLHDDDDGGGWRGWASFAKVSGLAAARRIPFSYSSWLFLSISSAICTFNTSTSSRTANIRWLFTKSWN